MARHGFRVMSEAERKRRTVQPTAKTTAGRLRTYDRAIEKVRKSQEANAKRK